MHVSTFQSDGPCHIMLEKNAWQFPLSNLFLAIAAIGLTTITICREWMGGGAAVYWSAVVFLIFPVIGVLYGFRSFFVGIASGIVVWLVTLVVLVRYFDL